MRRILCLCVLAAAVVAAGWPSEAQAQWRGGFSINIGRPAYYGYGYRPYAYGSYGWGYPGYYGGYSYPSHYGYGPAYVGPIYGAAPVYYYGGYGGYSGYGGYGCGW